MPSKSFRYTAYALDILQKIIGSHFTVSGLENIPKDQPIMFAANHFTRFETFFVPYLIYKHTSRQVRTLADESLYHGFLGRFLSNVGTLSTKNENRDKIIVKDLVENNYDWLIYPEGSMIKNKKIEKKNLYISHTPYRIGPVRTGSAVLALKSHLYRQDLIEAHENNNETVLREFKKYFAIEYKEELNNFTTYVVPLSITYYPIRPGENSIELFAKRRIKKLSPRIIEELQIEGNLLQNAQIDLHFGKPIEISQYIKKTRGLIYQIPIIKNQTKTNFVIQYFKHRLTTDLMREIYSNLKINFDHIFSAVLRHTKEQEIEIIALKRIIYLSAIMIKKSKKYRLSKSLSNQNLIKIFSDENNLNFDGVFNLAKESGEIVQIDDKRIKINKKSLFEDRDFHEVRIHNTLQVVFNEFSLLENASNIVKRNCKINSEELKEKVANEIIKYDHRVFEKDYAKYYDAEFSKEKEVGLSYFLPSKLKLKKGQRKIGVLLCHGYKSSPAAMKSLAEFLQNNGYNSYLVRLKGHGTSPINIKDVNYYDWIDSFNVGYAYLKNSCDQIIFIGFSTGGLLSLYLASLKKAKIKAIISVNSALRLNDIRSKFVPAINLWNDILQKMKIDKAKFEYIDDGTENPEFNYTRNYLHGVEELGNLMKICENNLSKISDPVFVIQAAKDPVVNPESAKLIYDNISSKFKKIYEPDFSNHGIINGFGKEIIFESILDFLAKV